MLPGRLMIRVLPRMPHTGLDTEREREDESKFKAVNQPGSRGESPECELVGLPGQHAQWGNIERSHQHGQSHSRSLSFNHLPGGLQGKHTSDGQGFDKHLVGQMCSLCLFIPTSGVTSLGAKPVPPVVRIRLSSSSSHHSNRVSWNTKRAPLSHFLNKSASA